MIVCDGYFYLKARRKRKERRKNKEIEKNTKTPGSEVSTTG